MEHNNRQSLWDLTVRSGLPTRRFLCDADERFDLAGLPETNNLRGPTQDFLDKSVLISCGRQLPAVLALLQLDGTASRVLLCPPDLPAEYLPAVIAEAAVDVIVSDGEGPVSHERCDIPVIACGNAPAPAAFVVDRSRPTEWLLFTSGTTGRPKMVVHSLRSLIAPLGDGVGVAGNAIWSTFYDVRRYGGLQMLLRCLVGGGSMVLSQADEPVGDFLVRAGRAGVTHMSGTPSHWRRAIMTGATRRMSPRYVRLSGEVVDQAILNNLARYFPEAEVAHAFASTEAGVAFDVRDGLAGFPRTLVNQAGAKVEMQVRNESLRIRSDCIASGYSGPSDLPLDADGFIDTGDLIQLRGDRYFFIGRRDGVINVGGRKVHPEEVEEVINRHPAVLASKVRGQRNAVMGSIVTADIVLQSALEPEFAHSVIAEIREACGLALAAHKVPATLRQVSAFEIAGSGKMARQDA